jgi:hypothetical protein
MTSKETLTRQEALNHLHAFLPTLPSYGAARNQVQQSHGNVSRLSASIRFRTLLEDEVIETTLEHHAFQSVEKWLQEVCWRRYWKGWLAEHPEIWTRWRRNVRTLHEELSPERLARAEAVMAGKSGVACMDAMARELIATGYLHNHARMWWASFWIHVERLPWELGADFFFRHLLDADPASNTLSWRWVAGLQTAGKAYLVRLSNIEKYAPHYLTENPAGRELLADDAVSAVFLREDAVVKNPHQPVPITVIQPVGRFGIWVHPDDLTPEIGPLAELRPTSIAACWSERVYRETYRLSEQRIIALRTVLGDGLARAAGHFECPSLTLNGDDPVAAVCAWAVEQQLAQVIGFAPMVGPVQDMIPRLKEGLGKLGIPLTLVRRPSDATAFSFASAGFFPFWQQMRRQLTALQV